jgi:hypothetical protein
MSGRGMQYTGRSAVSAARRPDPRYPKQTPTPSIGYAE